MEELDRRSVCRKTGVSPEVKMDVVTGVELECSYGAGDGQTRSGVASMPKERSGGPRLDRSCDWEKYGYDSLMSLAPKRGILSRPCPTPDNYPVTPVASQLYSSTPDLCASLRSRTCTYPSAKCNPLH